MARPRGFDEAVALDSAVETFWSGSFAGTSTEQLCASTGLSRSSLYNTFKGKAGLYREVLRRYGERKGEQRDAYLERTGTGRDLVERLLTDVLAEQRSTDDRRTCLVIHAAVEVGSADEGIAAMARHDLSQFRELLAELIARGQADGSIASEAPAHELASVVHATINGLQVAERVATSPRPGRSAVRTLMSLL